jgi:hypothetical protein
VKNHNGYLYRCRGVKDSVDDLKIAIHGCIGIPPSAQRLLFRDEQLEGMSLSVIFSKYLHWNEMGNVFPNMVLPI